MYFIIQDYGTHTGIRYITEVHSARRGSNGLSVCAHSLVPGTMGRSLEGAWPLGAMVGIAQTADRPSLSDRRGHGATNVGGALRTGCGYQY